MDEDHIVLFIFSIIFAGVGLLMLITKIVGRVKTRSNCTERVMATRIRLEKMSDSPDLDPDERAEIEQEEEEERKVQIQRTAMIEILAAIGAIGTGVLFMVVGLGLLD